MSELTARDIAYVRENYVALDDLCHTRGRDVAATRALIDARRLPQHSYRLPDGIDMVPADYFALVDDSGGPESLYTHFCERYLAAGGRPIELSDDWEAYLDGTYGVCLNIVTPENIVRKGALVATIERLLEDAAPSDPRWLDELRLAVDELDELERQFSPDFDRGPQFGAPPSRDRLVAEPRRRFPAICGDAAEATSTGSGTREPAST